MPTEWGRTVPYVVHARPVNGKGAILEVRELDRRVARCTVADQAVREAEPEPEQPERDDRDQQPPPWVETFGSWMLGMDNGKMYFVPKRYGQLLTLTAYQLRRYPNDFFAIARLKWLQEHFPKRSRIGFDRDAAAAAILREQQKVGPFRRERVRGLGYWRVDDGVVLNLGDRILLPDAQRYVESPFSTGPLGHMYVRKERLDGPGSPVLPLEDARGVLDLFERFAWERPASAALIAGWTVLAPVCGYLPWWPHLWVAGPAESGKAMVLWKLVGRLTAGMVWGEPEKPVTEKLLHERLESDALPVLIEESSPRGRKRVVGLMRAASMSATADGRPRKAGKPGPPIRSMFCFASEPRCLPEAPDTPNVTVIELRDPRTLRAGRPEYRRELWRRIDQIADGFPGMLLARTTLWVRQGKLDRLLDASRAAAGEVLGSRRAGDQYGTLVAGAAMLMHDEVPTVEALATYIEDLGLHCFVNGTDPGSRHLLKVLLEGQVRIDGDGYTRYERLGELVRYVVQSLENDPADERCSINTARRSLMQAGFIVDRPYLYIANQSEWIRRRLKGTPFQHPWHPVLRADSGAKVAGIRHFGPRYRSRATKIPLALLPLRGLPIVRPPPG